METGNPEPKAAGRAATRQQGRDTRRGRARREDGRGLGLLTAAKKVFVTQHKSARH